MSTATDTVTVIVRRAHYTRRNRYQTSTVRVMSRAAARNYTRKVIEGARAAGRERAVKGAPAKVFRVVVIDGEHRGIVAGPAHMWTHEKGWESVVVRYEEHRYGDRVLYRQATV